MSNPYRRQLSLAGIDAASLSDAELRAVVRAILDAGIHGIAFSPYLEGQGPGTRISEEQIRQRLAILRPHVRWIRSFSCSEGNERIPVIASEYGLRNLIGIWLDNNHEQNELEIANAIDLARGGHADIIAVGNEVLLRQELDEHQLLVYIERLRQAAPGIPVGYVDAYFQFADHPRLAAACDVILANCYPFWEGCPVEYALPYMKEMYRRAVAVAEGKPVIISETGWPNIGSPIGGAVPSTRNAIKYFVDTWQWAETDGIEIFYFSAFDETWKVDVEGEVGGYWGLWDTDGQLKYG